MSLGSIFASRYVNEVLFEIEIVGWLVSIRCISIILFLFLLDYQYDWQTHLLIVSESRLCTIIFSDGLAEAPANSTCARWRYTHTHTSLSEMCVSKLRVVVRLLAASFYDHTLPKFNNWPLTNWPFQKRSSSLPSIIFQLARVKVQTPRVYITSIWVVLYLLYRFTRIHLGVSKNRGTPKWMIYNGKPYFLMDDLGGKPTIFGNIHFFLRFFLTWKFKLGNRPVFGSLFRWTWPALPDPIPGGSPRAGCHKDWCYGQ